MGSTVSVAIGLAMTLVVFFFLPEFASRVDAEFAPLTRALAGTVALAAVAAASFYGELRNRRWRAGAHLLLLVALALVAWSSWPRR
jgi:hypothetical protein